MSNQYGPKIVTNGLQLLLDAGNSKSYPGTGSTWYDLSGSKNFTLINNPPFSSIDYKKFTFNGSTQYANFSQPILANTNEFTWSAFVRFNNIQPIATTPYYQLYIEENQVWIAQYGNALGIDLRQSDNLWFDGNGGTSTGAQIGKDIICRNTWYYLTWTFNRYGNGGTSGQVKGYLNGQLVNITNTGKTGPIINNNNNPFIASRGGGVNTYFDGDITAVSIYNRQLTDNEILNNYNAFAGKYYEDLSIYENMTYVTDNSANLFINNNGGKSIDMFRSGSAGWNRQYYSTQPFTAPCTIEFRKKAGITDNGLSYAMMAWNEDPTTNNSYTSLDYAAYPYRQDYYIVYNNGAAIGTGNKTWDQNEKFYIVYDTDGTLKHYNGSSLLYSVNYGTGKTVYVDSSLYGNSFIFGGFYNVRVTKQAWNGSQYV